MVKLFSMLVNTSGQHNIYVEGRSDADDSESAQNVQCVDVLTIAKCSPPTSRIHTLRQSLSEERTVNKTKTKVLPSAYSTQDDQDDMG